MTMNAKRRRTHDKLAALPGVRPVRRPVSPDRTSEFDLYYVRTGPEVGASAGHHSRRTGCGVGGAVPRHCAGARRPRASTSS